MSEDRRVSIFGGTFVIGCWLLWIAYSLSDIAGYLKGKGYGVEPVAPAPLEKTKTKKAVDADRPLRD